jgi:hypothetical protein
MTNDTTPQENPHLSQQHRSTQGLLAIWHGVEAGFEPSFDDWYDRQHHLERVNVSGFARARRYLNLDAGPRYFSRYEVDDASVLASAPYLNALNNPTEWTRTLMPRYRNTTRAVFRVVAGAGDADGGELVTLRLAGDDADAARAFGRREMAALATAPGVLRVEVWKTDSAVSTLRTAEKKLRGTADNVVGQAILVEGSNIDRLTDAVARHLLPFLAAAATVDRYRFVYQLQKHTEALRPRRSAT